MATAYRLTVVAAPPLRQGMPEYGSLPAGPKRLQGGTAGRWYSLAHDHAIDRILSAGLFLIVRQLEPVLIVASRSDRGCVAKARSAVIEGTAQPVRGAGGSGKRRRSTVPNPFALKTAPRSQQLESACRL